jgi:1-acyl-sn-glycerol-3-phosphate acyltransferase
MRLLRSLLFNLAFYGFAVAMLVGWTPGRVISRRLAVRGMEAWAGGVDRLLRLVPITVEVRGAHNLPKGAVLVASKHQSAWDTIVFHKLLDDPAIVLKRELLHIPLYGGFIRRAGMIPVDRDAGARSLRALVVEARAKAAEGRPILIFPEGSRAAPGQRLPYRPGAAALYTQLGLTCVPVALNSGLFWPRRQFRRRPGRIVLEFLPPIPPGLTRRTFAETLETAIETATDRLIAEAEGEEQVPTGEYRTRTSA